MTKIEKPVGWKINMFDFTITPLQVSFKKTTAQTYLLELCKGTYLITKELKFINHSLSLSGYTINRNRIK